MGTLFLIGNGFDINCGMHTRYTDVYKGYVEERSTSENLRKFKRTISANIENWGDFEMAMSINVTALFHTIQPVAAIMKEQGGGVIINTSSMVSISGQPAGVGYPTSKFAVNGMTLSLARELGKYNIRVNAVAPGITRTDMVAALPKETIDAMSARIPLQRVGEPQDVANAFLFLASDMASYVTGEILSVDGAMRS